VRGLYRPRQSAGKSRLRLVPGPKIRFVALPGGFIGILRIEIATVSRQVFHDSEHSSRKSLSMKHSLRRILGVAVAGMTLAQPALAADPIPPGEEQFKFMVGGVVANISSSIGLDGTANNGTPIDLETPNGSKNSTTWMLGATWRFASKHRIAGTYFATSKQRTLTFDKSITIGDDTLVPPTTLESDSRNRFLFATYRYSFVKNQDVELAAQLGAYVNKFDVDLTGNATVQNSGGAAAVTRTVSYTPGVTVPMPLIGATIEWFATPNFTLGGGLSGIKAKIGDVDGSVYVATVSAEYMFTRNFGAGVSFMHTDLDVDVTKDSFTGEVNWQNDNLLFYALLKF
jgi:hypothetical protein